MRLVDEGADPEDPDEYRAQSIFWVPPESRLQCRDSWTTRAIERDNPALKDVLPKDYARPALDKTRLGQVVDMVATSGWAGRKGDISIYGQESNYTTWRMARMNLAIRGIVGQIEHRHGDSFHNDRHPDLRADYILANPPFNVSDWGGERLRDDRRWEYGAPPVGNANFAWVQHFLYHLAPRGTAGFVLANGSMSSNQSGEGEIRKSLIEADLVDCIVALPGQLFRSTQIPACLWFLSRGRQNGEQRARRG